MRSVKRLGVSVATLVLTLALALLAVGESHAVAIANTDPPPLAAASAEDRQEPVRDALARTALVPDLQAPAAWTVIQPGADGELVTESGAAAGADADTPFLIGSLSKSLTAAAVMQLVDAGELRLDAPVRDYLTDFRPQDAEPITIARLLSQTSGFDSSRGLDARNDPTLSIRDRATGANEAPRGEGGFSYSNLNYAILGAVIEEVRGEPFATAIEQALFEPLRMERTTADPEIAQQIARSGHTLLFGVPLARQETVPLGAGPDGYTVSTANDYATFLRMLLRGGLADDGTRVLSEQSVRAMLTAQSAADAAGAAAPGTDGYGFGWGTGTGPSQPFAAHVGRTDGYFAHAYLVPSTGQAIVVLQAAGGPLYDQTAPVQQLAALFQGQPVDDAAGEPASVTVLIFAGMALVLLGAVLAVSLLRRRRDRVSPAASAAAANRRTAIRVALDLGGALILVVAWQLLAGLMFTGRPTLAVDSFHLSAELSLVVWLTAAALFARSAFTLVRHRRNVALKEPA